MDYAAASSLICPDARARLMPDVEQLSVRPDELFSFSKQTVATPAPFSQRG